MNWSRSLSLWEVCYIFLFLSFYLFYILRLYRIGRRLGKPSRAIFIKFFLRSIYFGLIISALLGPSFGISETEARSVGKDVFIVLDLSASMDSDDIHPSRLEKAKIELDNFLNQMESNRLSLMVFSTKAYWLVPLTFDTGLMKEVVSSLKTDLMPRKGSNLDNALATLANKLIENRSDQRPQIAVIITDGESFSEVSESTKQLLDSSRSYLYLVGVGTEHGAFLSDNHSQQDLLTTPFDATKLNLSGLTSLSKELKASLSILNSDQNNLIEVIRNIKTLESSVIDERKLLVINNKYGNLLLVALVLIILDIIFSIKVFKL